VAECEIYIIHDELGWCEASRELHASMIGRINCVGLTGRHRLT